MEDVPEILVLFVLGIIFVLAVSELLRPDIINNFVLEIYNNVATARNFLN